MKTKIATFFLFFFAIFSAFPAEIPSLKDAGTQADSIVTKTLMRIQYAWRNMNENFEFAWFVLRDRAVFAGREAEARARLGITEAKEKASGMVTEARKSAEEQISSVRNMAGEAVEDTGKNIKNQYDSTKKKVGEVLFE